MFWLALLAIAAVVAGIYVALHNLVFKRISSEGFRSYTSLQDYLWAWGVYLVIGSIGAFLLQLMLKFGPQVADLAIIPAAGGAILAMGLFALCIYGNIF